MASKHDRIERLDPREVVRREQLPQACSRQRPPRRRHRAQQLTIQALPYLAVRVPQAVHGSVTLVPFVHDRQVSALEQQRLGRHLLDIERGEQVGVRRHAVEVHGEDAATAQHLDQEARCRGAEPVWVEVPRVEEEQDVVGVVDPLPPTPVVSVVPLAYALPVESRKLGREHRV